MSLEAELKVLKDEIVEQHHENKSEAGNGAGGVRFGLNEKIQEYEIISRSYGDLFKEVLQEGLKMKDGYKDERKE